jgi:uncharacterized protein (DUF433 family)
MSIGLETVLTSSPDIRHGRPRIEGTGITVHRIAIWYQLGHSAEEIARRYGHISVAQVYAALAYYHLNREEIDRDNANDLEEAKRLALQHRLDSQPA